MYNTSFLLTDHLVIPSDDVQELFQQIFSKPTKQSEPGPLAARHSTTMILERISKLAGKRHRQVAGSSGLWSDDPDSTIERGYGPQFLTAVEAIDRVMASAFPQIDTLDVGRLLLNYVLSDPHVDVALVGMREPRFVDLSIKVSDDVASRIDGCEAHLGGTARSLCAVMVGS